LVATTGYSNWEHQKRLENYCNQYLLDKQRLHSARKNLSWYEEPTAVNSYGLYLPPKECNSTGGGGNIVQNNGGGGGGDTGGGGGGATGATGGGGTLNRNLVIYT
jgi:hypothetical protein